MTANNTTYQRLLVAARAIVSGGVVSGQAGGEVTTRETGGTFVCNGASVVTVQEPTVTSLSAIIITLKTVGGTVGAVPAIQTITAGTGFTVAGTASDTSTYNYLVVG